jgi:hypothetical protein
MLYVVVPQALYVVLVGDELPLGVVELLTVIVKLHIGVVKLPIDVLKLPSAIL